MKGQSHCGKMNMMGEDNKSIDDKSSNEGKRRQLCQFYM